MGTKEAQSLEYGSADGADSGLFRAEPVWWHRPGQGGRDVSEAIV